MKNKIDNIVKEALLDEVKEISNTEVIFNRIREEINTSLAKRREYNTSSLGFKKYISLVSCLLLLFTISTFVFSTDARALASEAIASIKTIFTIEEVNDQLQIVEKPADEVLFGPSVCRSTEISDEEIQKLLGFTVKFPVALYGSFNLQYKSLGVELRKSVDYETSQKLENDMLNAIENDKALNKLKLYDAQRNILITYEKPDQSTIFIKVSQHKELSDIRKLPMGPGTQIVKIGELDGVWVETSGLEYPNKDENGVGKADVSKKPTMKKISYLMWQKSNKLYNLNIGMGHNLEMEEALKIAEDFMKYN